MTSLKRTHHRIRNLQSHALVIHGSSISKLSRSIEGQLEMGKSRSFIRKKKGIKKFKFVVEKLQKSFSLPRRQDSYSHMNEVEEMGGDVPEDVKEGHFAVIAYDDGEPKRFVVALNCLRHPEFLRLLEQAAEEFGFDQEGALTIPCRSNELERILCEHGEREVDGDSVHWMTCTTMVKSH